MDIASSHLYIYRRSTGFLYVPRNPIHELGLFAAWQDLIDLILRNGEYSDKMTGYFCLIAVFPVGQKMECWKKEFLEGGDWHAEGLCGGDQKLKNHVIGSTKTVRAHTGSVGIHQ